jgi:hypothetical protein
MSLEVFCSQTEQKAKNEQYQAANRRKSMTVEVCVGPLS